MVYQRPLAYLLGLEGVALLRGFGGDYDRDFIEARIAEIRRLLDDPSLIAEGVEATRARTVDGYRVWSATYDRPGNGIFVHEEPVVCEILDSLPVGVALDAACGTGRYAENLAARGHRVIGVDSSPDMLERARACVPQGDFRQGDLHELPLPDDHVDIIVCALALTHVADLGPVIAEFARVLRPGGHLLVSDVHQELVYLGSVPRVRGADGEPRLLPAYRHRASDYLNAALPLGLQVRRCDEPRMRVDDTTGTANGGSGPHHDGSDDHRWPADYGSEHHTGTIDDGAQAIDNVAIGPWDGWPWSLHGITPAAHSAAYNGTPATIIWHFQLVAGR